MTDNRTRQHLHAFVELEDNDRIVFDPHAWLSKYATTTYGASAGVVELVDGLVIRSSDPDLLDRAAAAFTEAGRLRREAQS